MSYHVDFTPETAGRAPSAILLVDDEPEVRRLLELVLNCYGFTVHAAASGREAVEILRGQKHAIAVALLDVQMPGMDGLQTLKALQQVNPDIQAVFMSGNTGCYTEAELLALGAAAVMSKPFRSLDGLAQRLKQIIEHTNIAAVPKV